MDEHAAIASDTDRIIPICLRTRSQCIGARVCEQLTLRQEVHVASFDGLCYIRSVTRKGRVRALLAIASALAMASCSLLFDAATGDAQTDAGGADAPPIPVETAYEEAVRLSAPAAYYRGEELVGGTPVDDPLPGLLAEDATQRFSGSYQGEIDFEIAGAIRQSRAFRVRDVGNSKLVPPMELVDLESDFTIELLLRVEGRPGEQHGGIFIREDHEQAGIRFGTYARDSDAPLVLKVWCDESGCGTDGASTEVYIEGSTEIEEFRWYHIVLLHSADTHRFEVRLDGRLEIEGELPIVSAVVGTFQTGFGSVSGKVHNASFDEIAVYHRVLDDSEIRAHYDAFVNSR